MRFILFIFLFTSMSGFAQTETVSFVNEKGDRFLPGTITIKVRAEYRAACKTDSVDNASLNLVLETMEFISLKKKFPNVQPPTQEFNERGQKLADISLMYELKVPETIDILKAVRVLNGLDALEYAEPHYVSFDMYVPNDANLNSVNPYHFTKVAAYDAWDVTQGDTNVVIGITDTSFDTDHEDLAGNIKYNYEDPIGNGDEDNDSYIDNFAGWDMVDNDNDLFINNEIHGTAVAAIASASADNGIGYAGIGFKCKFLPVKVGNNSQTITKGYEGIQYCVDHGCSVINCSWGNTTFNQAAQDVINWAAINNDVVIVASAGNASSTDYYYPASYEHVLSVTGVDADDLYDNGVNAPFTRNDSVDVSAPGFNVYTTATFNGSFLYSPPQGGTSMAAPIVSGVAGLVRSQFPCLTALEVIERIKATADPIDALTENIPFTGLLGTGRVNAHSAVLGTPCSPVGISNVNESTLIEIYPNPSTTEVSIVLNESTDWNVNIFDAGGKLVLKRNVNSNQITLSGLSAGFYVAQVSNENVLLRKKFTVIEP